MCTSSQDGRDDITKRENNKSNKYPVNDISKSILNPNTKSFIYTSDSRPLDLLDKGVVIPKEIGNATSLIILPLPQRLSTLSTHYDCVFGAIFATSFLLSLLIIGHVVNIPSDNVYDYIYPNFTSNDDDIGKSIRTTDIDVDISILNTIRSSNLNNVVIGLLNINSFSSKYDAIKLVIQGKIDVMVIVETKLDDSYPISQFHIDGYATPFRRDRNKHGGGILIYVREDIPCKLLDKHIFPDDIEGLFVELNFRKSKLLLLGTYPPPPPPPPVRMIITISTLSEMPWKCITQNMKKKFWQEILMPR